jgi:hypothetical protein
VATCNGTCGFTCNTNYVVDGNACEPPAPRPVSPLTGNAVSTRTPTLTWKNAPGFTSVHVDVCGDRACNMVYWSTDVSGTSVTVGTTMPSGVLFWRLFSVDGGVQSPIASPTWEFETLGTHSAGHMSSWWNFADMEGDGYADLVDVIGGFSLLDLPGSASGVATTGPTSSVGNDGPIAGIGDVNGDGYTDVVLAGGNETTITVFFGGSSGIATTPSQQSTLAPGLSAAATGDVDGDGYTDVVAWTFPTASTVQVMAVPGSASGLTYTVGSQFTHAIAAGGPAWKMAVADINGDGYMDLVGGDLLQGNGTAYVFLSGPSGLPSAATATLNAPLGAVYFATQVTSVGDVNGDGYQDVVISDSPSQGGHEYLYLGGPNGLPSSPSLTLQSCSACGTPGPGQGGDVNGDGYSDILVSCCHALWVYFGGASGPSATPNVSLVAPSNGYFSVGQPPAAVGLGDVNGDGVGDFVGGYSTGSLTWVYFGSTTPLATTPAQTLPVNPAYFP